MYLGKERRDRTVALVLAAVLVGGAVLGLLVTLSAQGAGSPGAPGALGAAGAEGSPYGAAPAAPVPSTALTTVPPVGQEVHPHGDSPPIDPGEGAVGHPWRLVGTLVGVVLLFGCGVLVTHEVRRRAEDEGSSGGSGEWIS